MQNNKLDISVIMPALNEQDNIEAAIKNTLAAFTESKINGEIIVINDGSSDRTKELVENFIKKANNITLINHNYPNGIGASFWDGIDKATGQAVVMLPGDNENEPKETLRYLKLLEDVDVIVPFLFNKEVRATGRNILSSLYKAIINATFCVNFNYTNGTIIYRKSILKDLDYRSKSFFFQTDILIRTAKKGYLFAEVPYRLGVRKDGASKALSFSSLLKVMKGYLRLARDYYFNKNENKGTFTTDSVTGMRRIERQA